MLTVWWPSEEPALNLKHWKTEYLNSSPGSKIGYLILRKSLPFSAPVSSSVNGDDVITRFDNLTGLT